MPPLAPLILLVLAQASAVPPPPPMSSTPVVPSPGAPAPGGYPTYSVPQAAPTVQIQQGQPAGVSSTAYVVGSIVGVLAVALSGGGAVVAIVQARAARAAKQLDVQAETARQLPGVLAEVRKTDRADIERLWLKCDQQDERIREVDAKLDAVRTERSDCLGRLGAVSAERDRYKKAWEQVMTEHAKCPKPAPRPRD